MEMNMIRTKEDNIMSLQKQAKVVYAGGEKVEDITSHPTFKPHINCAAMNYEMANKPEFEDLAIATSHLTGETINRFTHIHQSVEDLIKKVQLLRAIAHETGSCFQRCVGWHA
jgi:4-hydroxybutyryl-CoA dehydratase/vinylacetyl-CoA-Delta-isomerase